MLHDVRLYHLYMLCILDPLPLPGGRPAGGGARGAPGLRGLRGRAPAGDNNSNKLVITVTDSSAGVRGNHLSKTTCLTEVFLTQMVKLVANYIDP